MSRKRRDGKKILVWMRRSYRVQDHAALWHAVQDASEVIPLVCLDSGRPSASGQWRRKAIRNAMIELDHSLRHLGGRLFAARGDAADVIPSIAQSVGADAVYAIGIYDPAGIARDNRLKESLASRGIHWRVFKDAVLFEHGEILTGKGMPYQVYTPYRNAWEARSEEISPTFPALRIIRVPESVPQTVDLKQLPLFGASGDVDHTSPRRRLSLLVAGSLKGYTWRRDFLAMEGTSRLSSDIALGKISIREVYWRVHDLTGDRARADREDVRSFLGQLIWRDFYYQVLANFPHVADGSFKPAFGAIRWSENRSHFEAWKKGETGYPIVDAAMHQLLNEGWMHNRARMIVASFLTKDLHIDWRRGEQYFFQQLADGDIASNNGGWQWSAGTGTDASPYFRIFNPVVQGKRFDPQGAYVKKYLPELRDVPARFIHHPWTMTGPQRRACAVRIGTDYPAPIVDHSTERMVAINQFKDARRAAGPEVTMTEVS